MPITGRKIALPPAGHVCGAGLLSLGGGRLGRPASIKTAPPCQEHAGGARAGLRQLDGVMVQPQRGHWEQQPPQAVPQLEQVLVLRGAFAVGAGGQL